jgi:predicted nucleic acid-binding protein
LKRTFWSIARDASEPDNHRWNPVALTFPVLEAAWTIESRYSLSLWDALIVAAAQAAGCDYLLSEDMQHGQDLDGVEVIDPFRVAPEALL